MNVTADGVTASVIIGPEVPKANVAVEHDHLMFLVKWKGWSHIHNTWNSMEKLSEYHGYKKLLTYVKKLQEHEEIYAMWPEEEQEAYDAERQQEVELLETHVNVERICAHRSAVRDGGGDTEYFTKWEGLTYDEASWEGIDDIVRRFNDPFIEHGSSRAKEKVSFEEKIDEYHRRKEGFTKSKERTSAFSKVRRQAVRHPSALISSKVSWDPSAD